MIPCHIGKYQSLSSIVKLPFGSALITKMRFKFFDNILCLVNTFLGGLAIVMNAVTMISSGVCFYFTLEILFTFSSSIMNVLNPVSD